MSSHPIYAQVNMYGPGGPHTALREVVKAYKTKTNKEIIVNFGPQGTWNEKAKKDADILFGASDQSALAIANAHKDKFDIFAIEPIFLRRAIILVRKGNPKKIKGLKDLTQEGIAVIVPDGMGVSNTSGTGVWEDMIGRTKDVEKVKAFRKNIISFNPNSGSANKIFLENKRVDAWITWIDWAKSNPDYGDIVEIEPELVVYRSFNIVPRKEASRETLDFINFLHNEESRKIFNKFGWD
jgi:accessory colonization factor AcfC